MSIDDCFISAYDVGSLVCVLDWERVFEESGGDSMFSYKGPVDAVDLGPRVHDCSGVNVVTWVVQSMIPSSAHSSVV